MGGTLQPEDMPSGGLTVVLALPAVESVSTAPDHEQLADPALLDYLDHPRPGGAHT
jgi:hypothetical protein